MPRRPAANQLRALAILESAGREFAGIEVADAATELARSSVYAALAALQRDRLVDARWDVDSPHPRRMLRINDAGRRALEAERARLTAPPRTAFAVEGPARVARFARGGAR
jgi:DNA-binding PadR family transcriptional regulator